MTTPRPGNREDGSALVAVLVMIAVLSTLVGAVLSLYVARHRFVVRDVHRAQAVYVAEAGIHAALARLYDEPEWRPDSTEIDIAGTEISPIVTARAMGGYLQLHSSATIKNTLAGIRALSGQRPPDVYEVAVVLGDTLTALSLAGTTEIHGDVIVGRRGVRFEQLGGRPFRGDVRGETVYAYGSPMPPFDDDLFRETIERAGRYVGLLPTDLSPEVTFWPDTEELEISIERLFVDSLQVVHAGDGVVLSPGDSLLFRQPILLVAKGDVRIEGDVHLQPGSQLLAGGAVSIDGSLRAEGVLLYGDRVTIRGLSDFSGQVLARRAIKIDGGARLSYPSTLYVAGTADQLRDDRIEIGTATVEGSVLVPAGEGLPPGAISSEPVRVFLGENALVRGGVYCARRAEVHGRIEGTLLTNQTYFYNSPASYVNWLNDAAVIRPDRPASFHVPVGLGEERAFEIVSWNESLETVLAEDRE